MNSTNWRMKFLFCIIGVCVVLSCQGVSDIENNQSIQSIGGTLDIAPDPGDLSTIEGLKKSDNYQVEVRRVGENSYRSCFVYKTLNTWKDSYFGSPSASQESVSFTSFSFKSTEVEVKITTPFPATSVKIRPLNYAVSASINGNQITFKLASPKKISVEVNDRKNPLFLFADEPDIPNLKATYYYGPGIHHIGLQKVINSGESVYLSAGAVVEGSFLLPYNTQNISIKGRGILTMGEWKHESTDTKWLGEHAAIKGNGTHHLQIEGITIANSCGWTIPLYNSDNKTHDNQFRNLKLVSWNGNTDGIWVNGDNNLVDDCFMFTNDDLIMSHGATNCKISNLVGWGGVWGRLYWAQGSSLTSGILFENINLIGKEGGGYLIMAQGNNNINIENITFRNLRVEAHPVVGKYLPNKFIVLTPGSNKINNWLFENVTIDDQNPDEGDFYGNSIGVIRGITFKNLTMKGVTIHSLKEGKMDANENASDITFN